VERDVVAVDGVLHGVQQPAGPGHLVPGTVRYGRDVVVQRAVVVDGDVHHHRGGVVGDTSSAGFIDVSVDGAPVSRVKIPVSADPAVAKTTVTVNVGPLRVRTGSPRARCRGR
jgi:hypothetical protein